MLLSGGSLHAKTDGQHSKLSESSFQVDLHAPQRHSTCIITYLYLFSFLVLPIWFYWNLLHPWAVSCWFVLVITVRENRGWFSQKMSDTRVQLRQGSLVLFSSIFSFFLGGGEDAE